MIRNNNNNNDNNEWLILSNVFWVYNNNKYFIWMKFKVNVFKILIMTKHIFF